MKSIKKKAEEYDRVVERISANKSLVDVSGREYFEAGANYVLEQIEQLIYEKHVEGSLPLFDLTHLIDKLKEK